MKNKIEIEPIDVDKVETDSKDVIALYDHSQKMVITSQTGYETASDFLKKIKARAKELDTQRKEITSPLDIAKSNVMDLFRKPLDLLSKAEALIKQHMIGYTTEQERKAREEQQALQKLADAEAEKQKKILDAKIARAEAAGKLEKAELLAEQKENIIPIPAPVITANIETPKGISYRDKYSAEVIDADLVPREYLIVNQSALDKVAQATKGTIKIAGVKFNVEKILASRL